MRNIVQIIESRPAIKPNDLEELEERLHTSLPPEYRSFVLSHNGGCPEPDTFLFHRRYHGNSMDVDLQGEEAMVQCFHCLDKERYDDIRNQLLVFQSRLPPELLPVAHDPGGNLICVAIKGADFGAVLYWDHENEAEEGEAPTYRNIYYISNNFDHFLSSLYTLNEVE